MEPNRQYRVDTGRKNTIQSRRWNQTNSKEQTMESNRQYRVDARIKQTVKSRLWNQTDSREDSRCKQTVQTNGKEHNMEPNRQQRTQKTLDANRQYRVDAGIKQTVKRRLWNQTDSTGRRWNQTVKTRLWNETDSTG